MDHNNGNGNGNGHHESSYSKATVVKVVSDLGETIDKLGADPVASAAFLAIVENIAKFHDEARAEVLRGVARVFVSVGNDGTNDGLLTRAVKMQRALVKS